MTSHEPAASAASRPSSKKRKALPLWQETILLVAIALVLALVVKTFLVQAFWIPSGSMEDTLQIDDRILVQKVSYWTGEPERGDVVVFDDPGDWLGAGGEQELGPVQQVLSVFGLYPAGGHLVKRVIGVGGDRVVCCDAQGRLEINGTSVDEPYLKDKNADASSQRFDVKVPDGRLWLMGDNRDNSADSRAHLGSPGGGFVNVDAVLGKSWVTVWPFDRMGSGGSDNAPFAAVPDSD
ncbi:signal peptidase I [Mumia sp. Pv 4-285]|uniref:signal peptidase I n=1 Tax=Mumia qirimensis TaxID=3234852 RepID=UPI00351CCD16